MVQAVLMYAGFLDDDRVLGHVLEHFAGAGLYCGNLVDGVHAFDDPPERCIAPSLSGGAAVVQEVVVDDVDEELGGGGMRVGGSGHGNRPAVVPAAPVRLVADGRAGLQLLEFLGEASALNHEAGNHPVKDGAVVETVTDVGEEVLDRLGSGAPIEFQNERAVAGLEGHLLALGVVRLSGGGRGGDASQGESGDGGGDSSGGAVGQRGCSWVSKCAVDRGQRLRLFAIGGVSARGRREVKG